MGNENISPTVVLVHGAFADSSSWNGVVERLRAAGISVIAAANPLRGLDSDAAYIASVLDSIEGDCVLVGHSYGGSVITVAAAGKPNVTALVYIAAFIPDIGESALELTDKFPGSTLGPTTRPATYPLPDGSTGTELYIRQDAFHTQFAADTPAATGELMGITQRPVALAALQEGPSATAWRDLPTYALLTTEDKNIPIEAQRNMAERANATTVEVTASHAVAVSRPADVAELVMRAAARH
ncbi:Pimeloyl-ACP methyl ester carboxylesterase [Nocardia amikacinitolerans]|uniref:alpha/beta fold hydrolase n=1 Tax=Nocardia amikacinitolerans TaxID=756689 RepID=UPI000832928D|nr:alpha/beta hydrolase [Nocardia amikacinitolerans]MCP2317797.1 Pimeloyl-ACP methyl ester carboxylesterase [Nocardia amikacinitolerans]